MQEYPLSKKLLAMSHVWRSPSRADFVIAAKVAPESIIDLCHLDEVLIGELSEKVRTMAAEGLRVLGVARAYFMGDLPSLQP